MYRLLPAAALLMLAADTASAQQRQRDAFDDWREPAPRYIERYRPPHEPDPPPRPQLDRRNDTPPGWQVSPRDWRDAERRYGFRAQPDWPPRQRDDDRDEREQDRYRRDEPDDHYREPPVRKRGDPYAPRPAHLDRAPAVPSLPPLGRRGAGPEPLEERPRSLPAPQYAHEDEYEQPRGQKEMSGGAKPHIAPMQPTRIAFSSRYAPGTVVIETAGRQLLLIVSRHEALRYPISVGRQGFAWTGTERIKRIADWPDWHPPASMRQREPYLPLKMTGGIRNPLGAKALYLGNSLYRIHGTNDARTIGLASSSGCFRMLNGHVVDLAGRVGVGTTVVVVDRLPGHAIGRAG